MSSNSGRIELGVRGTSVLSRTWTKYIFTLKGILEFYVAFASRVYTWCIDASKGFDHVHLWCVFDKLIKEKCSSL